MVISIIRTLILSATLVLSSGAGIALAQDLYASCIKGYDFGTAITESFQLAPFDIGCQTACKNTCNIYSKKDRDGHELNYKTITDCISTCQSGTIYSGYYYEQDTSVTGVAPKLIARGPLQATYACPASQVNASTTYKSSYSFKAGEQVKFSLGANPNTNKLYLCGKHTLTLQPLIQSPNPSDWTKNTIPTTALKRTDNICAMQMPDSQWNSATNFLLWSEADYTFWPPPASSLYSPYYQACIWNARSPYWTNTQIWVVDGDELNITWYGLHMAKIPTPGIQTYKDLWFAQSNSNSTIANEAKNQVTKEGPSLLIASKTSGNTIINGESFRVTPIGKPDMDSVSNPPTPVKIWGLTGNLLDTGVQVAQSNAAPNCDTPQKQLQNAAQCNTVTDPGMPMYSLSGVLNGFSPEVIPIYIMYPYGISTIPSGSTSSNSNNDGTGVGGLTVHIEHGGCPYLNGSMIQYAFASTEPPAGSSDWKDLNTNVFSGVALTASNDGNLFLKIKDPILKGNNMLYNVFPELSKAYTKKSNRYGYYNITITLSSSTNSVVASGPIKELVNTIRFTLYGDPSKPTVPGVIEKLYNNLIKQNMVIRAIQAVLILYISFTAIGFLIGTVQMHQLEVIKRITKFAFVVAMISPTSWDFFANHFYKLFIDGGLELIAIIIQGSLQSNNMFANIQSDPASVFVIFDGPFKIFFSKQTWIKISALIFQGFYGILVVFFIIYAAVYYALSIAKAVLMFVSSLITIGVLIFVAPLFFCFMLFNFTKNFFDSWWKFLLSFTLQPVAVFASISIFNILIIITLENALGFTVCPDCLFQIKIPIIMTDPYCVIPIYKVLLGQHVPGDTSKFYLPYMVLQSSVLMMILCKGMFDFCDFIASNIALIVSGSPMFQATVVATAQRGQEAVTGLVGMDQTSQALRRNSGGRIHMPKQ